VDGTTKKAILIVEDDESHRELARRAFIAQADTYEIALAATLGEAYARIDEVLPALVITDMVLPDGRGVDILGHAQAGTFPLVVMTSFGDENMAVSALKAGALDYVVKSLETLQDLPHNVERTLREWDNITKRREAEEGLRQSERRFHAVFDQAFQLSWLVDADGVVVAANRQAIDFADAAERTVLGTALWAGPWWSDEPDSERVLRSSLRLAAEGGQLCAVVRSRRADGSMRTMELSFKPLADDPERVPLVLVEGRDETERRRAEAAVEASLLEKDILLREIHHRVKNNLQVIESLLRLQAESLAGEAAQTLYENSVARIRAMSHIHELLYQSEDFALVDFPNYLRILADDLLAACGGCERRIDLRIESANATLTIDQALPCGLVVNEILSNALKHAFPSRDRGLVTLKFADLGDGSLELEIRDDGKGLPPGVALGKPEHIGLYLASVLAEQLGGSATLADEGGVRFTLRFKKA